MTNYHFGSPTYSEEMYKARECKNSTLTIQVNFLRWEAIRYLVKKEQDTEPLGEMRKTKDSFCHSNNVVKDVNLMKFQNLFQVLNRLQDIS